MNHPGKPKTIKSKSTTYRFDGKRWIYSCSKHLNNSNPSCVECRTSEATNRNKSRANRK